MDRFQWVMDLFYPLRAWCCQTRKKRTCQFAKVALQDTGCSSIVVKGDLVPEEDKLREYAALILADGTVRNFQRAMVDVYIPYLCGPVKAFCMKTPVYDLIIGNVEGARNADAPDPLWDAERCAVRTRRQAKTEGQNIPLKVADEVDVKVHFKHNV